MDLQRPQALEHAIELLVDARDSLSMKEVVKATLHTIFFHRYFVPIVPLSRDLLELTLPAVDDIELETLVEQRATALVRAVENPSTAENNAPNVIQGAQKPRAQICIQFFERKRKKTYFFGKADEEICWEQWTLDVVVVTPRSHSETVKVRRAMERSLQRAITKIITIASRDRNHIPPITSTESNPFPYQILINPKLSEGWAQRMGIFAQTT